MSRYGMSAKGKNVIEAGAAARRYMHERFGTGRDKNAADIPEKEKREESDGDTAGGSE